MLISIHIWSPNSPFLLSISTVQLFLLYNETLNDSQLPYVNLSSANKCPSEHVSQHVSQHANDEAH